MVWIVYKQDAKLTHRPARNIKWGHGMIHCQNLQVSEKEYINELLTSLTIMSFMFIRRPLCYFNIRQHWTQIFPPGSNRVSQSRQKAMQTDTGMIFMERTPIGEFPARMNILNAFASQLKQELPILYSLALLNLSSNCFLEIKVDCQSTATNEETASVDKLRRRFTTFSSIRIFHGELFLTTPDLLLPCRTSEQQSLLEFTLL